MKSLVVGMNQTREKLRCLNLHLIKKHQVARKKRVMLLVGNISLKEQEFLELSLEQYFVHIRGYHFRNVCCAFCCYEFHLERELLKNWKPYQLKRHVRIRTKEKPYICKICNFRLKYHIHCHKGGNISIRKCFSCIVLTVPNVAKGSETYFIYINIIRPQAKTKLKCFNALFVENVSRKSNSLCSIKVISIKTLKGFLSTLWSNL